MKFALVEWAWPADLFENWKSMTIYETFAVTEVFKHVEYEMIEHFFSLQFGWWQMRRSTRCRRPHQPAQKIQRYSEYFFLQLVIIYDTLMRRPKFPRKHSPAIFKMWCMFLQIASSRCVPWIGTLHRSNFGKPWNKVVPRAQMQFS